jgi:threonine dehydrogenase-like Zn-dependent dehydrogenase
MGPIGIGTALFAKLAGAEVTLMEREPEIADLASRVTGIASKILVGPHAAEEALTLTAGDNFDVVFDATGNGKAMEASVDFAASGGTFVMVGVVKDRLSFSDPDLHRRELTLYTSRNATREDFDTVVSAMRAGHIPTASMASATCALDELPAALPRWAHNRVGVIKAMAQL